MSVRIVVFLFTILLASTVMASDNPYPDIRNMCSRCELGFCPDTEGSPQIDARELLPEEECDEFRAHIDSMVKFNDNYAYPHCGTPVVELFSYKKDWPCWDNGKDTLVYSGKGVGNPKE